MHLKRLEAFGFKSFADRVVFDFEPGVTALVGPNGCGKSNVVDAVKWVLGEQSAKSLRGGEMLDVIFNGSGGRKPLNFSEVTLVFDNASGKLPLGAPEVAVTRRLYRSGDSEYMINKAQCRLRDVRELFWDTGIGTASYSIIEQGRISALLEANNKDRRILFEEAAGIHKYKERKRIALRKLERVEQNLERLTDLLGEVDRNLKSVSRQAEKARRAKDITDKLRQTKLDWVLYDAFTTQAALQEVTASLQMATERAGILTEELKSAEAETAQQQSLMAELDVRLREAQNQLSEGRGRLERLEAEIIADKRSIEDLTAEAERARATGKAAGERAAAIAQERERVEMDHETAKELFAERNTQVETLSVVVAGAQAAREELTRALETARRAAQEAAGRRSQLQDTLVRAEAELGSIEYRVRRSHAQMTKAEDQLRFAQAESEELRGRMSTVTRRREYLEDEQNGLRTLQARTDDEIERLGRIAQEFHRDLESSRSRLTALEGLRESGEGLSPGARQILTTTRHELNLNDEVHGLVADLISVDPKLEQAIEAALGIHVETIVVDSARAAKLLAQRLGEQEMGRATFLPLDRAEAAIFAQISAKQIDRAALNAPGCLGCAADLVTCDERHRVVVQALLGNVLIFDTERNAADAFTADKGSARWNRVSLTGDFFESCGVLTGGRFKAQRLGLIGRKNEIQRLYVKMDLLRLQIEGLGERTAFLEKRAQKYARDEERLRTDLGALALTFTELRSTLAAIEREEARSTEEKTLASQEIHELEAERSAHIERVNEMRTEFETCKRTETETVAVVQAGEVELNTRETSLAESRTNLNNLDREKTQWRERVTSLEREGASLSAQFAERRDEADRESRRATSLDERRESAASTLTDREKALLDWSERIQELSTRAGQVQEEKDNARGAFDTARGREREIANEMDRARQELSEVRDKEVNLRVRLEGKLDQARGEFQLDALQELASRGGPPPVPPEAMEAVRQLEEKLAKIGPVNMYALEEMAELEKRHSFLKVQFEDLDSARASLKDVISRINRRSRTLFQETFEKVRGQFQEIFRKLFGGGKADVLLEEGEDILEAGIEITARPPGKEPRNVSLLSGGEKTMTMIALLFAIFRSRPAPFCILDEVDAPLDEANVDRFNLIVQDFRDQSQFVVITHNKRTMSYANTLYGITMPEPGVSKRIAIKFEEIEKHLPMDEINKSAERARQAAKERAENAVEAAEDAPIPRETPVDVEVRETESVGGE